MNSTPNTPPKKQTANLKQQNEIRIFLETVLTKRDDGFWCYSDDHTDVSVAKTLSVSVHSVRHVRQQLFGLIRPYKIPLRASASANDLFALEAMELRLRVVEDQLQVVRAKLASLL